MIDAKNIYKSFVLGEQSIEVLRGVSLTVDKGEFVALMGPSGSGKSTLLYILGGLDRADSGDVFIDGSEIGSLSDEKESILRLNDIGFVFQAYNLIDNLTVEENILIPALLRGEKRSEVNERLEELLRSIGLLSHRKHRPMELSGGQQQRTAIARAIINSPNVLFADEPTGNLDSHSGEGVLKILRALNKDAGITILMVTHSEEAAHYSNRIIQLKDGQLAQSCSSCKTRHTDL
jgi:putative ABC transport system ATP-binding protein